MRALFASALRQHARVFLSARNPGFHELHPDGRRYFADKGPGRRDYTDPGFQKHGYIDPGCFAYTQKERFRKADRGSSRNSHILYSSGEMDVFKVKDCSILRRRQMGDARREFENSKEASSDAPPRVFTFNSAAPQNNSSAGKSSKRDSSETKSSKRDSSEAKSPKRDSSKAKTSKRDSSEAKRSHAEPPKAPGTRRGYKGAVARDWSNFDYAGSRLDEFSKRMAAKKDKDHPDTVKTRNGAAGDKKMAAKTDKDHPYTLRTNSGADEFFERWRGAS